MITGYSKLYMVYSLVSLVGNSNAQIINLRTIVKLPEGVNSKPILLNYPNNPLSRKYPPNCKHYRSPTVYTNQHHSHSHSVRLRLLVRLLASVQPNGRSVVQYTEECGQGVDVSSVVYSRPTAASQETANRQ